MKEIILVVLALCGIAAAQPVCSVATVRGTYAVAYDGWALMAQQGSPMPLALPGTILGVVSIDRDGQVSGGETVIIAGQAKEYDMAGSVEIQPDCTGILRLQTRLKGSEQWVPVTERFVALPKSASPLSQELEIRTTIMPQPGSPVGAMALGIWTRMSTKPGSANW